MGQAIQRQPRNDQPPHQWRNQVSGARMTAVTAAFIVGMIVGAGMYAMWYRPKH
jgi:hypothetical protein